MSKKRVKSTRTLIFLVIVLFFSFDLTGNTRNDTTETNPTYTDSLLGDFNGDGIKEKLYVRTNGCIDEEQSETCICIFSFSNNLPSIRISESMGADLYNLGDLNNDGSEEFGYVKIWHGDWQKFHVFTLKNNVWMNLVPSFWVFLDYFYEKGLVPIEKDPNKKGNVIVRSCKKTDLEPIIETKSIKI